MNRLNALARHPLAPYLAYIVIIAAMFVFGIIRMYWAQSVYDGNTFLEDGLRWYAPFIFFAVILLAYLIRLLTPYFLARRFSIKKGNDARAQSLWHGAIAGSILPELVVVWSALSMISTSSTDCTDMLNNPCGDSLFVIIPFGAFLIGVALEFIGCITGYFYSVFSQRQREAI